MSQAKHRYVPQGSASLASDAPGWTADASPAATHRTEPQISVQERGPICWKCKGAGSLKLRAQDRKKQRINLVASGGILHDGKEMTKRNCPVCNGRGYLPMRSRYTNALNSNVTDSSGGSITARRRRPIEWKEFGHVPSAVQACIDLTADSTPIKSNTALVYLAQANGLDTDYSKRQDVFINETSLGNTNNPTWLPINKGEQLCNLVGRWRILQRIGSHRWTTDDIVTAYIAATFLVDENKVSDSTAEIKYLDLGTGNGSVLQMVTWYLLSKLKGVKAYGIEARSEAVGLARRSLAFNLGVFEHDGKMYSGTIIDANGVESTPRRRDVQVVNGDFRDLVALSREKDQSTPSSTDNQELKEVASHRYDLITGTPPYFRVDFSTEGNKDTNSKVTAAVINQGGMPTSMQSAPARCEVSFRQRELYE